MKATTLVIALLAATEAVGSSLVTGTTPLGEEAEKRDILLGSGPINPAYLDDPQFATLFAEQFNSLSPKNELQWSNMVVKGQDFTRTCCEPYYILTITDPTALRAVMMAHFEVVMRRCAGIMNSWDVVSEAIETQGGGLAETLYSNVLGPAISHMPSVSPRQAGPDAKLSINENLVESLPGKRQELRHKSPYLWRMVSQSTESPYKCMSLRALGLGVSIAGMDVHTLNDTLQTEIYGAVVDEALHAGIIDIRFWGFMDKHEYTWLSGAKPLMFDEDCNTKGSFYATHAALANFVNAL
ncbi:hypothetical protein S7711_06682 [Stachybotrys chartarum IBT 7711]|uniref:endo-1,4-beta-xylanase n=1 Tax=Stachybotrys chartarum (strain CBS 109288 / IBT 7711) TaxID=1280523 RepID=A0A084BB55_STACB|nr:hypothetical protein S7711_06682 [Stachybotrys chartarum IBT 7711]